METLNKIKQFMAWIIGNKVPLLFLLALTLINIGIYLGFGAIVTLISVGITLIVIVLILVSEQSGQPPQNK